MYFIVGYLEPLRLIPDFRKGGIISNNKMFYICTAE